MSNQPEALRLADRLTLTDYYEFDAALHCPPAAAELRRLHAENENLRQIVQDFPPVEAELREVSDRAHRLEQQKDALLEALKLIATTDPVDAALDPQRAVRVARAAIAKAEGEK